MPTGIYKRKPGFMAIQLAQLAKARDKRIAPIEARLFANRQIDTLGGCWIWTGTSYSGGYGRIRHLGQKGAHRAAAVLYLGLNAEDHSTCVLHKCANPPCFNPDHLYLGSLSDNARDRVMHGHHFNANKTHCKRGHPYSGENLHVRKSGQRVCRKCHALRQKRRTN